MHRTSIILPAALLIVALPLHACRLAGPPGDVELVGPYVRAAEPVAAVEVFLEPIEWEQRPYETVARLTTDVRARDFPTLAEAEAQGYERLRFMAARAGALAVVDIEQWVTLNGEVVAIDAYDPRPAVEDYIIHMRARAVRFRDIDR